MKSIIALLILESAFAASLQNPTIAELSSTEGTSAFLNFAEVDSSNEVERGHSGGHCGGNRGGFHCGRFGWGRCGCGFGYPIFFPPIFFPPPQ